MTAYSYQNVTWNVWGALKDPKDTRVTDLVVVLKASDDHRERCSTCERENVGSLFWAPIATSIGVKDNQSFVKSNAKVESFLVSDVVSADVNLKTVMGQRDLFVNCYLHISETIIGALNRNPHTCPWVQCLGFGVQCHFECWNSRPRLPRLLGHAHDQSHSVKSHGPAKAYQNDDKSLPFEANLSELRCFICFIYEWDENRNPFWMVSLILIFTLPVELGIHLA